MEKPVCVVFADAFAYQSYIKLGELDDGYSVLKLKPGIAYSSNLHYMLFDGKKPDDVGFFTDYSWKPGKYIQPGKIKTVCDRITTINNLYRVLRRKITKRNDNIPFCEMPFFVQEGTYKFMTDGTCSVFGQNVYKAYGKNMEASFDLADRYLREGGNDGLVVVLEVLDHTGHEVGSMGEKYMKAAETILKRTRSLFKTFRTKHDDGVCVLISDHGMVNVKTTVNVTEGLERKFGLPGKNYQFYNDSLYLRVWAEKQELLHEIRNYLDSIDCMYQIDVDMRKKYGATQKKFGDLIYLLREGYAFDPNCFGVAFRGSTAGLHGYMESSDSASGIVVTDFLKGDIIDALDVYRMIRDNLYVENS